MTDSLVEQARRWRQALDFLSPEVLEDLGRMFEQLDQVVRALPPQRQLREPAGWAGLARRGPWQRLLLSEWALAQEVPDEFLRRAGEGELSFWELAEGGESRGRDTVLLFDAGPEQLGACRVVQMALLFLFWERSLRLGGELLWGVAQRPDCLFDVVDRANLRWFLQARTFAVADRPPAYDRGELWCIGSPAWLSGVPARVRRVGLRQASPTQVELEYAGRRFPLQLPAGERAQRWLRSPFPEERGELPVGSDGRLRFSNCGKKLLVIFNDGVHLCPVPQSPKEQRGKIRRFRLETPGPLVALGWWKGALLAVHSVIGKGRWLIQHVNPGPHGLDRLEVAAPAGWSDRIGSCILDSGTIWIWAQGLYSLTPQEAGLVELYEVMSPRWGRLCGESSLFLQGGVLWDRHWERASDLELTGPVLIGAGERLAVGDTRAVLACAQADRVWTVRWRTEAHPVQAGTDDVVGVVPWAKHNQAALVERYPDKIVLRGPGACETLNLESPLEQLVVSPSTPYLVYRCAGGPVRLYSSTHSAYLGEPGP